MEFTSDWFTQHIVNWTTLLKDLKDKPNLNFLEIGCFEGRATTWLLENILTDKTSRITCIDLFEDSPQYSAIGVSLKGVMDRFKHNTDLYKNKITLLKGSSQTLLKTLKGEFDFIYVDGSHETVNTLVDAVLSWPLLKKDGIMVFDDYTWYSFVDPVKNPFLAIDAFLSVYRSEAQLVFKSYQVFVKKL